MKKVIPRGDLLPIGFMISQEIVEYSHIEMKVNPSYHFRSIPFNQMQQMSLNTFVKSLAHTYRNDMLARLEHDFGEFDMNGERASDPERVRTSLEDAIGNNIHQFAALSDFLSEPNVTVSRGLSK